MIASIVDLRYRMRDILKALERKEKVKIIYHGKEKGVIVPTKRPSGKKVVDHSFFGILKGKSPATNVTEVMEQFRGGRYRDI